MLRKHLILTVFALLLGIIGTNVMADSRINVVHHFGGDALFCNEELGCWALNMDGERLWEVDQATIDAAMTAACDSNAAQQVEAGQGTYGPMTLEVNCYGEDGASVKLIGYDEHGKPNEMSFAPNYTPVNAPASSLPQCQINLHHYKLHSHDGIHYDAGYDVFTTDGSLKPGDFQYWTSSNPGLPSCAVRIV